MVKIDLNLFYLILVQAFINKRSIRSDRYSQSSEQLSGADLGQLLLSDGLLLLLEQDIQLLKRGSMEQMIAGLPKDQTQLRIVVEHLLWLDLGLAQVHQRIDVLDGLVRLLPQLHRYGVVQLKQTRLQVVVLCLGFAQINRRRRLIRVLVTLDHVLSQCLA